MADEISDRFRPISDEDLEEARRWSIAGNEDNLGGDTIPNLIGRIDTLEAQVATLSTKLAAAEAALRAVVASWERPDPFATPYSIARAALLALGEPTP